MREREREIVCERKRERERETVFVVVYLGTIYRNKSGNGQVKKFRPIGCVLRTIGSLSVPRISGTTRRENAER